MPRTVRAKVTVSLELLVEDGKTAQDILDNMDYSFSYKGAEGYVRDHEIVDAEILSEKPTRPVAVKNRRPDIPGLPENSCPPA